MLLVIWAIVVAGVGCSARAGPNGFAEQVTETVSQSSVSVEPSPTGEEVEERTAEGLISQWVSVAPLVDGEVDAIWTSVLPFRAPLTWGMRGTEHALDVELRSVHTDETLYFLARWSESQPSEQEAALRNKLTIHFAVPEPWPGASETNCLVACHTAFADERGVVAYVSAETIPPGRTDPLPAAGGWRDGFWQVEWSRPLLDANLFDVQFTYPDAKYPVFVKVFVGVAGRADPVSETFTLAFRRADPGSTP